MIRLAQLTHGALGAAFAAFVACGGNVAQGNHAAPVDAGSRIDATGDSSMGAGVDSGATDSGGGVEKDSGGTSCASGETICAGVCVDEQTDDANCGGCGLVCTTGCMAGRCMTAIAGTGAGQMGSIAVDSTSVYWAGVSDVYKAPLDGGVTTTLASGQLFPAGLAVDSTSVYWTNFGTGSGSVVRVSLEGGSPTTLASGLMDVGGTAVDSTRVYWGASPGVVMALSLDGGAPSTFGAPGVSGGPLLSGGLVLAEGSIYWVSTTGILHTPLNGDPTLAIPAVAPGAVAANTTSVYWTDTSSGVVMRAPLAGGTPVTLAKAAASGAIAADGQNVYFASCSGSNPCSGAVMKVPVAGGSVTTIALMKFELPSSMAVDATSVYFTTNGGVVKITPK